MKCATLTPAYGRDYKHQDNVKMDFLAGKDFILHDITSRWDGKPCSIRDMDGNYDAVQLRYNKLQKACFVVLKD